MSVQKLTRAGGTVYRARVKSHGVEVATKVFDKRKDAVAWEQEQRQRLRAGTWIDPARGRITFDALAADWLAARQGTVKRRTFESDEGAWRRYIQPRFGRREVHSVTAAEVSVWMGELARKGLARTTVNRALAVLRLLLQFAVEDKRVQVNVAAQVRPPTGGRVRREAQVLSLDELHALAAACETQWSDVILVLGLQGLRWGELAGLQVRDVVFGERPAIRVSRTVLASGGGGEQYIDTVKNHRARTVPLVAESAEIIGQVPVSGVAVGDPVGVG